MMDAPLFDDLPITLKSHWEEFDTPEKWAEWLRLCREHEGEDSHFADAGPCYEHGKCDHLDAEHCWCKLRELPATYNPVFGGLGMACCGFGHSNGNGKGLGE